MIPFASLFLKTPQRRWGWGPLKGPKKNSEFLILSDVILSKFYQLDGLRNQSSFITKIFYCHFCWSCRLSGLHRLFWFSIHGTRHLPHHGIRHTIQPTLRIPLSFALILPSERYRFPSIGCLDWGAVWPLHRFGHNSDAPNALLSFLHLFCRLTELVAQTWGWD